MRRAPHELNQIPTEFHEDGASELPELPDEFNRFPRPNKPRECSRLRKIMLLLAAAGLTVLGVFALQPKETKDLPAAEAQPTPSVQTETEAPVLSPMPTTEPVKASPTPTETPIPTETAIPSETPKETPTPTPGVSVSYYYRASEVYYAMLFVSVPERVSSVSFRLTAPDAEEPALEIELTPQEIEDVVYVLRVGNRDEGFDANEYFAHHPEADLNMELTYTIVGETAEKTVTETIKPAVEDWIYWRFDSEEDVGGIGEMMFGTVFPNCFTVRIFDTTNPELKLTVGSDADTLGNGDVTINILIDGSEIPAEGSELMTGGPWPEEDGMTYYAYMLVIPIPEDFPQHGTAVMRLTRKLMYSDTIIIREKTVEY